MGDIQDPADIGLCTEHRRVLFAGKVTNATPLKLAEGHFLEMTQTGT